MGKPTPPVILARLDDVQNYKLKISDAEGHYIVLLSDIHYLKASNNYTEFHLRPQPHGKYPKMIVTSQCIKQYEFLFERGFGRPNKSYLVNLDHIVKMKWLSELDLCCEHKPISIATAFKDSFKAQYEAWLENRARC